MKCNELYVVLSTTQKGNCYPACCSWGWEGTACLRSPTEFMAGARFEIEKSCFATQSQQLHYTSSPRFWVVNPHSTTTRISQALTKLIRSQWLMELGHQGKFPLIHSECKHNTQKQSMCFSVGFHHMSRWQLPTFLVKIKIKNKIRSCFILNQTQGSF